MDNKVIRNNNHFSTQRLFNTKRGEKFSSYLEIIIGYSRFQIGTLSNISSISNSFIYSNIFICYLSYSVYSIIYSISIFNISISTFYRVEFFLHRFINLFSFQNKSIRNFTITSIDCCFCCSSYWWK
jgi:hypothetical protein